jgi:internalin A
LRLQVRKELSELPAQKIPVAEFAALCRRHGISDAQAMRMLDAFHDSGIVLHFGTASSSKLRETVFIKPRVRTRVHRSKSAPQSPHCCSLIVSLFPP